MDNYISQSIRFIPLSPPFSPLSPVWNRLCWGSTTCCMTYKVDSNITWLSTHKNWGTWCDWHPCWDSVLSRYMCLYWSEWYLITSGSGLIHVHHPQRGVRLVHRTPFLSFLCTYTTHAGIATLRWVHCVCRWDYVRIRKRKCHGCG